MKIIVGSANNGKIVSVRECIQEYDFLRNAVVEGVDVSSGVSSHPKSLEKMAEGAMNRAVGAFRNAGVCEYSVGLESGLMPVPYTRSGFLDFCFCVWYNGMAPFVGMSSGFEYPLGITNLILDGVEASDAARRTGLTDHPKIGTAEGIIGIMTKGRITRNDYTKQSIMMALTGLEYAMSKK